MGHFRGRRPSNRQLKSLFKSGFNSAVKVDVKKKPKEYRGDIKREKEYALERCRKIASRIRALLNGYFVKKISVDEWDHEFEMYTGCTIKELADHLKETCKSPSVNFKNPSSWHLDHIYPIYHIPYWEYEFAHYYKNLQALPPSLNEHKSSNRPRDKRTRKYLTWYQWTLKMKESQ